MFVQAAWYIQFRSEWMVQTIVADYPPTPLYRFLLLCGLNVTARSIPLLDDAFIIYQQVYARHHKLTYTTARVSV